ncbi:hypothetical protein MIR68_003341 [Amoeboaphelidium protococcarum]|nr:hypothetical protein MIR68_003341 [Amoeboaphelidium protococcarum]
MTFRTALLSAVAGGVTSVLTYQYIHEQLHPNEQSYGNDQTTSQQSLTSQISETYHNALAMVGQSQSGSQSLKRSVNDLDLDKFKRIIVQQVSQADAMSQKQSVDKELDYQVRRWKDAWNTQIYNLSEQLNKYL